jgi:hypothetical protein
MFEIFLSLRARKEDDRHCRCGGYLYAADVTIQKEKYIFVIQCTRCEHNSLRVRSIYRQGRKRKSETAQTVTAAVTAETKQGG